MPVLVSGKGYERESMRSHAWRTSYMQNMDGVQRKTTFPNVALFFKEREYIMLQRRAFCCVGYVLRY